MKRRGNENEEYGGSDSSSEDVDRGDSDESVDSDKLSKRPRRGKAKRGRAPKRELVRRKSTKTVGPLLYLPGEMLPELEPHIGQQLQVHILAEYLTFSNDQVKKNEIWGMGPYSDDSDIVCMLQHSGLYSLTEERPSFHALTVTLRILPGLDAYKSGEKNQMKSKSWGHHDVSLGVESVEIIDTEDAVTKDLVAKRAALLAEQEANGEASVDTNGTPVSIDADEPRYERRGRWGRSRKEIAADSDAATDMQPYATRSNTEKRMAAENAASSALPKDSFIVWNLSNEPCFRYSFALISDRGTSPTQWTSYRLRSATLFLETDTERYELSALKIAEPHCGQYDAYRFARVKGPERITRDDVRTIISVPLPLRCLDFIINDIDWSEFAWGTSSLVLRGVQYQVKKLWWQPNNTAELKNQYPFSLFSS